MQKEKLKKKIADVIKKIKAGYYGWFSLNYIADYVSGDISLVKTILSEFEDDNIIQTIDVKTRGFSLFKDEIKDMGDIDENDVYYKILGRR